MVERDSRKLVVEGIIYQISFLNLTVLLNQLSKVTSLNLRLKSCYQVMQICYIAEKAYCAPCGFGIQFLHTRAYWVRKW